MSLQLMESIDGAVIGLNDILYARGFTAKPIEAVEEFAIEIVFVQPNTMLILYYKDEATRDKDLAKLAE